MYVKCIIIVGTKTKIKFFENDGRDKRYKCRHLEINALPATTSTQGRADAQNANMRKFDFESIQDNPNLRDASIRSKESLSPISQLYDESADKLDMSLNKNFAIINNTPYTADASLTTTELTNITDDLFKTHQNTLDDVDEVFGHNEQHESSTTVINDSYSKDNGLLWKRQKQSIPVLEPVRHLLNTVRNQHNETVHAAKQYRQTLATMVSGLGGDHMSTNESSAIETEEDRETANDSTEFKLLDFLGSIGSMLWSLFGNLQRAFAASSGNVLASSSSGSSDGQ